MAKIQINEVEHYNNNSTNFFKLENDRDTARVRFMYNDINDVQLDVVHEVEVNGKKRLVNCLRTYDEPVDNCPLCKAGMRPQIKLFVPVYNTDKDEVQFWQKGKTFIAQLNSLCDRYKPLVGTTIEVERNGKKGDQATKYQFFPGSSDSTTLDDLPEIPDTLNSFILNKTYDELSTYARNGSFDADGGYVDIQRRPVNASSDRIKRPF